ncbi:MAG: beta-ketoacyl-[acyl-carrier-protein] synthase family protein [Proteobacteria bacterium]|nr:beta-ketoacyl-[acyl-carrier-protein] synthase family protein [Pseudomonadota bacterium]MBU1581705.1 beta-ketoacyl-[acyl-carrier-protein] synthase family protein [Pseudomonadota bacterium]MBU2455444.1 beta-ketoacyl-[acyl-carrier-protein] synthase family protein [Pseudomonadota bacterium]
MKKNRLNKAAITGIGIISCLGNDVESVASALKNGRSGIVYDEQRKNLGFKSPLTSKINGFSPKNYGLTKKALRTMCEPALFSFAAATDAVKDSRLSRELIQSDRCGIIFGNDSTIKAGVESVDIAKKYNETHYIGSGYVFRAMNSTITMNLASHFKTRGANWTISAACASGAHVIGQALMLIRSGLQDIIIAGGAQETNWMSMASFDSLNAFSSRTDEPGKASRPFDKERNGLVPGGGAASIIIEDLDHALSRGANIYCIIDGYGFSSGIDKNLSEPNAKASAKAMENALGDAGISPQKIDYISAHATSTPTGDLAEAIAINKVFGPATPVSSTKSMTGHECWMSGASEVVYTILMAQNKFIAPNINFSSLSDNCPQINVIHTARQAQIDFAISNSFGFGGTNAAIVLNFNGI